MTSVSSWFAVASTWLGRQDDDARLGEILVVSHRGQNLEAAPPRHHHVEDHDVGTRLPCQLERLLAVVGLQELVRTVKADADQFTKRRLVITDEHGR